MRVPSDPFTSTISPALHSSRKRRHHGNGIGCVAGAYRLAAAGVKLAHQRPDQEGAVDTGMHHIVLEATMECRAFAAQLAHVAQHDDAAAILASGRPASTAKAARMAAGLAL